MMERSIHTTASGIHIQRTRLVDRNNEKEIHLLLTVDRGGAPAEKIAPALVAAAEEIAKEEQAPIVFLRFFVPERETLLPSLPRMKAAVSVVAQPPADGSSIAVWAYLTTQTSYTQLWTTNLTAAGPSPQAQTEEIFRTYIRQLQQQGLSLAQHCQRTWLFVTDIDNNYAGMVRGRNTIFDSEGLTASSHYIASTGIAEDGGNNSATYVMMDAVAYLLPPENIRYLYAPQQMNRTSDYGVRFERGTVLTLPHSTQIIISGTASIDNHGAVLHEGDVRRQAQRMMENISALLTEGGSTVDDIQQAIIYLRNASDSTAVEQWLAAHYPSLPHLTVVAAVCRPQWLLEMECLAIHP